MSKKTKKWKAKYEDMFECCLRAETDLRHEQQKFYQAQAEGAEAQARVRQLEGEAEELIRVLGEATAALDKVSAQRDEAEAQVAQTEHLRADLEAANRVAEDMARQRDQRPSLAVHQALLDELVAERKRAQELEVEVTETEFERVRSTEQRDKLLRDITELRRERDEIDGLLSVAERERDEEKRTKAEWVDAALAQAEKVKQAEVEITKLNDEQEAAWERGFHEGHAAALYKAAHQGDTEPIPTVDVTQFTQVPTWHGLPDPRGKIEDARRASMHEALDMALREADPRGPHEPGCTKDPMHTGSCFMTLDEYEAYAKEQGLQKQPLPPKSAIEVPKPVKDEGEGMLIAYVTARELQPGDRVRFDRTCGRFLTVLHADPRGEEDGTEDCLIEVTVRVPNQYDSTPFGDFTYDLEGNAVVERNENP